MSKELYQETNYYIKKKNVDDNLLSLSKFENLTRGIGTKLSSVSCSESVYEGLSDTNTNLINADTGEIIIEWDDDHITYLDDDYEVNMTQSHFSVDDQKLIKSHNDFIQFRTRK